MANDVKNIFFVGIGGIGLSGLAKILRARGAAVSGSDATDTEITRELSQAGISVSVGHRAENLPDECDLLVYSNAVPEENPEREIARRRGIRQTSYPEAVGELLKNYEKIIAVAGTNGKTTTTAMVGWVLEAAGFNPTVLVGSKVLAWGSNVRIGGAKYFVLEADEYRRAFMNYRADIAVITNIAADHLDYYNNLADVQNAFRDFSRSIKAGGVVLEGPWKGRFNLKFPSKFNQENAAAAAAICKNLGIEPQVIEKALAGFSGTWRRFQLVGVAGGCEIISDYAHHPDGIRATLQAARELYPEKSVLTVFQPHQRNRTKRLFGDFVKAFCQSDFSDFAIAEIFDVTGRENRRDQDISSRDLVRALKKCGKSVEYAEDLKAAEALVRTKLADYDIIIVMGAGDIYTVADKVIQ